MDDVTTLLGVKETIRGELCLSSLSSSSKTDEMSRLRFVVGVKIVARENDRNFVFSKT